MNERPLSSIRLLVVDDDSDLRAFLQDLLVEEGYDVDVGATMDEALVLLDTRLYHLVLTDLLSHSIAAPLRSAVTILAHARPTPVAALTGWTISPREVTRAGLACLIPKPFDLSDLLALIASYVEPRLTAEQQRQAETLRRFCDGVNAGNVSESLSVCAADLRIIAPENPLGESGDAVEGKAACRAFMEDALRNQPSTQFDDYVIYGDEQGLALRYQKSWAASGLPSGRATTCGALFVRFNEGRISQIEMSSPDLTWKELPPERVWLGRQQDSQS